MALGVPVGCESLANGRAGPPRRSDGSGLGVAFACTVGALRIDVAWELFACAVGRSAKLLQSCNGLKLLKR